MAVRSESITMDAIYRSNQSLFGGRNNSRVEWVRDSDVMYILHTRLFAFRWRSLSLPDPRRIERWDPAAPRPRC
jgi:hypothetical protein